MERTLISETPGKVGENVKICGWVNIRRDHGKLIFMDIRDRSGMIQTIIIPDEKEAYSSAKYVRDEYIVEIEGLVKERPACSANEKIATGKVELEVKKIKVLAEVKGELPFSVSEDDINLNLTTLLDNRIISLRNEKRKAIFKIYAKVLEAYAEAMRRGGFLEIKTPKIVSSATEGGANFFKIKYFSRSAFLAQSPQFYKQAGVGIFERVFEIGSVFRAEPHFTSRHVNEYIGLDAEMGFIESLGDVMDELAKTMQYIFSSVKESCSDELQKYGAQIPEAKEIPRLKLSEALKILDKEFGKKIEGIDIDPEGERLICEWAEKKYGSELVFLTHYPVSARPFYTMPSRDGKFTESFDLLFRGTEIATGGQRIHSYNKLVSNIKKCKLNPEQFKDYLENFRYGMPPHGGWGLGSERIVQKLLGLKSVKEAVLFPRDVKRLTP